MMTFRQAVLFLLLPVAPAAAQNVPAATAAAPYTGFELPDVSGTLRFSLNAGELYSLGYNGENSNNFGTSGGGSVAYLSGSPTHPFSVVYTGSYISTTEYSPAHVISNLALSQVIPVGRFQFIVANTISYTPENPVTGLSGVPGLGDNNVPPVTGTNTGLDIQTVATQSLNERISGTVEYSFSAATTLSGSVSRGLTRYLNVPGGSTTDDNEFTASSALRHKLDPYTSIGVQYVDSESTYITSQFSFHSQTFNVNGSRQLTPALTVSGSIGPQFSSSSNSALEPSTLSYAADAAVTYHNSFANGSLGFGHGTNAGSGLVQGTETTSITGRIDRQIGSYVNLSANAIYSLYNSLQAGADTTHSLIIGGQANRALVAHTSVFVSYTAQRQLNQGFNVPSLALNGTTQTISIGVSYAPDAIHIGRQ